MQSFGVRRRRWAGYGEVRRARTFARYFVTASGFFVWEALSLPVPRLIGPNLLRGEILFRSRAPTLRSASYAFGEHPGRCISVAHGHSRQASTVRLLRCGAPCFHYCLTSYRRALVDNLGALSIVGALGDNLACIVSSDSAEKIETMALNRKYAALPDLVSSSRLLGTFLNTS